MLVIQNLTYYHQMKRRCIPHPKITCQTFLARNYLRRFSEMRFRLPRTVLAGTSQYVWTMARLKSYIVLSLMCMIDSALVLWILRTCTR